MRPMTITFLIGKLEYVTETKKRKTHPAILSMLDFDTSSPRSIMLLPITLSTNGFTKSVAAFGPANAKISLPEAAIALAPKTGDAMKEAPAFVSFSEDCATVSGCTVDVSTKVLPMMLPADRATSTRLLSTLSFEI
jgi:hypothetical protein